MIFPRLSPAILAFTLIAHPHLAGAQRYDTGAISPQEQYMLELINAARANPAEQAKRLGLDLNRGLSPGAISASPKPPLVMHRVLLEASRLHSSDMLARKYFDHTSPNGVGPSARAQAQGFPGGVWENIANVGYGQSGKSDTWATLASHNALFRSAGHRRNMLTQNHSFIGLGVIIGPELTSNKSMMTTQKYAPSSAARDGRRFVTGVAYLDLDKDRFYTPGEGIAGVKVTSAGNSFWAQTRQSGGFAMPVARSGEQTITFDVPGAGRISRTLRLEGSRNRKLDLRNAYRPPVARRRGPALRAEETTTYQITSVAGSSRYDIQYAHLVPAATEGAEQNQRRVIGSNKAGAQKFVQSVAVAEGKFAYYFPRRIPANPDEPIKVERITIELEPLYIPSLKGRLEFQSRLGMAWSVQEARVEVLSGGQWVTVWSQSGSDWFQPGEMSFRKVEVPLEQFAGEDIRIRFSYDPDAFAPTKLPDGDYVVGWYFDDVRLPDVRAQGSWKTQRADTNRLAKFTPQEAGTYRLRSRAHFKGRPLIGATRTLKVRPH